MRGAKVEFVIFTIEPLPLRILLLDNARINYIQKDVGARIGLF